MDEKILPSYLKERIASLPGTSGVYLFKDEGHKAIYIGKALSIKKRVQGHFRFYSESFSKEGIMLSQVRRVDFIETPSEAEALLLEASLVKDQMPKYNQLLKDDKSWPFLKITNEEFPRLVLTRKRKGDGAKYFGPYTDAGLLRQALKFLRREFPLRTCRVMPKKVCLLYHIGQCTGPCEKFQNARDYAVTVKELESFLDGKKDALVRHLSRRMKEYSAARQYEKAQIVFNQIRALSVVPVSPKKQDPLSVLELMRDSLELPVLPRRIEGFDISNIHGKEPVASMVVCVDGKAVKSEYRRFKIKTVSGIDDYLMMKEVVRRRYSRLLEEKIPLPDLILIDGGKGHLNSAKSVLDELGLSAQPIISIAKQHEYIFKPERKEPYIFSLSSPVLHILQSLRNEAHRFAISFHRNLHRKAQFWSVLDDIPGIGPVTKKKLIRSFGDVQHLKTQSSEDVSQKAGINEQLVKNILFRLNQP